MPACCASAAARGSRRRRLRHSCRRQDDGTRILQFDTEVDRARVDALCGARGAPLRFIPDYALLVGVDAGTDVSSIDGLRWYRPLPPAAKISTETRAWMLSEPVRQSLQVITVHGDVTRADAMALLHGTGATVVDRPSLDAPTFLASVTVEAVRRLADADDVAWIIPASEALAAGREGTWCPAIESVAGVMVAGAPCAARAGTASPGAGRLTYLLGAHGMGRRRVGRGPAGHGRMEPACRASYQTAAPARR
jgi:hypothetical protein